MKISLVAAGLLLACAPGDSARQDPAQAEIQAMAPDSLVLILPDSAQIWLADGMLDTAASGETCQERTLEIRRGETRIPVPLLYTLGGPTILDDTTVRASLVRDCAPYASYLVNTRSGQPRRAE